MTSIKDCIAFGEIEILDYIGDRVCTARIIAGEDMKVGYFIKETVP